MRIIGGQARGRVVRLPSGSRIRPTADRVKESLFNILHSVEGSFFLDLFAGSGNIGLEALSRGARFAVFVEKDIRLVRSLEASIVQLGFETRAEVIAADAKTGLGRLVQRGSRFDIIFTDPPYDQGLVLEMTAWPDMIKALAENGIIVLQHSAREKPCPEDRVVRQAHHERGSDHPELVEGQVQGERKQRYRRAEELPAQPWVVADQRRYGDTVLTFLKGQI